ncbi:TetR/AcrR family transcriptional regulator [Paracoccus sp. (in: a-proteobacteria)]|uniref:TetR/AcrR family transcriptional regulator n=1 Tax=Paracoccus sp. TaxID=267 RepID=UPI0028A18313|nr:TetR/AcrR family transcriptional regulator [Paracoccus sp. (in: a-proteobacteria)]
MITPLPDLTDTAADEAQDSPKRCQILDGARKMFLSQGFEGTSMQDVARAAKVSKGTLYVYFDSKEAMFKALVLTECDRMQQVIREFGKGTGDVRDELHRIARHMIATLVRGDVLAAMRMMIGAGEKFPDLARHLYASGPMRSAQTMANYLSQRNSQGDLAIADSQEAAAEFLDLMLSGLQRRALLMMPALSELEIDTFIAHRLDRFLMAYRP